jgi:hypothetical protein
MLAAEMVAKKVAQSVSIWASWSVGLLAAMTVAWMVGPLGAQLVARQTIGCAGFDVPRGLAACAVGHKSLWRQVVHDGLGHDAARRVAGANEKNVERSHGKFS